MRTLAIRGIPLSKRTSEAWRSIGVTFTRTDRRNLNTFIQNWPEIINLGYRGERLDHPNLWNPAELVSILSSKIRTREILGELLPPQNNQTAHWIKGRGHSGKQAHYHPGPCTLACPPKDHDTQIHLEGPEYRILTVGTSIIQAHNKVWKNPINVQNTFPTYSWVGTKACPKGTIPLCKLAISILSNILHTDTFIIGWDIKMDKRNRPYIIEGNSCPGINNATAHRIRAALDTN